jgi:hypothetical protein
MKQLMLGVVCSGSFSPPIPPLSVADPAGLEASLVAERDCMEASLLDQGFEGIKDFAVALPACRL